MIVRVHRTRYIRASLFASRAGTSQDNKISLFAFRSAYQLHCAALPALRSDSFFQIKRRTGADGFVITRCSPPTFLFCPISIARGYRRFYCSFFVSPLRHLLSRLMVAIGHGHAFILALVSSCKVTSTSIALMSYFKFIICFSKRC